MDQAFSKIITGVRPNENGTFSLVYSWIGCEPLSMRFSSEGYEEKDVLLGSDEDGQTVQFKLAKLPEQEEIEQPDPASEEQVLELHP